MLRGNPPTTVSPFVPPLSATSSATSAEHAPASAAVQPPLSGGGDAMQIDADERGEVGEVAGQREAARGVASKKGKKRKGVPKSLGDGWVEPDKKLSNKVLRAVLQHGMLRPVSSI